MKISTKTSYAMRFMVDLAARYESGADADVAVPLKDIATRQDISKKYLEQVVSPLCNAGLLDVTRGKFGGYRLAREPRDITLYDIVQATEGGRGLLSCLDDDGACMLSSGCPAHDIWGGMQDAIESYLRSRTLQDVTEAAPSCIHCS